MPSLQLLQLTERGRGLLSSRRNTLLLATSIVAVDGTAAAVYVQSRSCRRVNSFIHSNGVNNNNESDQLTANDKNVKKSRQKRVNLRSLQVFGINIFNGIHAMSQRYVDWKQ